MRALLNRFALVTTVIELVAMAISAKLQTLR